MEMGYMAGIISELFDPIEKALENRKTKLTFNIMEDLNITPQGTTTFYHPKGDFDIYWPTRHDTWTTVDIPGHFLAENNRIIDEKEKLEQMKKTIKGFLRRGFLKAETAGDLPALLPESIHTHFPAKLQKEIYNSAPVLNRWAIEQFINQEQTAIKIIRRQLFENVILRG